MTAPPRWLAACALLVPLAVHAESAPQHLPGGKLAIIEACADPVSVTRDAALSGEVVASGDALAAATGQPRTEGGTITFTNTGCEGEVRPLSVRVPPGFPVQITRHGDGRVAVGTLDGPLTVTLGGAASLRAERLGAVRIVAEGDGGLHLGTVEGDARLELSGNEDVVIGQLAGPTTIRLAGSGDLSVGAVQAPSLDLDMAGSGDVELGAGRIERLRAGLSGSGDLTVAARVGDADVSTAGSGDATFALPPGSLRQRTNGSGTITVADDEAASQRRQHVTRGVHGAMAVVGSALVLVLGVLVLRRRRRRWHRAPRPAPTVSPGRASASSAQGADPGLAAILDRLVQLDARLARIESFVASPEFELRRGFRDMAR